MSQHGNTKPPKSHAFPYDRSLTGASHRLFEPKNTIASTPIDIAAHIDHNLARDSTLLSQIA